MWYGIINLLENGPFSSSHPLRTQCVHDTSCQKASNPHSMYSEGVSADNLTCLYFSAMKFNSTQRSSAVSQRDSSLLSSVYSNRYIKLLGYHFWPGGDTLPQHILTRVSSAWVTLCVSVCVHVCLCVRARALVCVERGCVDHAELLFKNTKLKMST